MTVVDMVAERAERARQALVAAEAKTGVMSLAARSLERDAEAWPGQFAGAPTPGQAEGRGRPSLQTPGEIAAQAAARLVPGSTVAVAGSSSLLFAIAAAVWGEQGWGAVAALPDAGLLAARQAGVPLERSIVVPDMGPEPLRVLAALVDSHSVIVIGGAGRFSAADRRRVEARVRHRHAYLVVDGTWPGARLEVGVEHVVWSGAGCGEGSLSPVRLAVRMGSHMDQLWVPRLAPAAVAG